MIIARRIGLAVVVAAVAAILCAALGLRSVIHGELGSWASRFGTMPAMDASPNMSHLYQLVDLTLSISCGLGVFLAVLIAIWLGASIGRRVGAIDRGLATLATGRRSRIEENGNDELGRIAHSANLVADNIEHAKDAERELVAGLAHDLAHPLTALRGSLEAARDRLTEDVAAAAAERLLENVAQLEATLSDLRDVSAYDAGLIRLDWTAVDLAGVARSMVAQYEGAARRRGIGLEQVIDGPLMVYTDLHRLQRIIANLLVNAFAVTCPGKGVVLRVHREGDVAILEVEDAAGAGAMERLARALEGQEGCGLGLRVVHTLASALQANVAVRKAADGSAVQVRLRVADHGTTERERLSSSVIGSSRDRR